MKLHRTNINLYAADVEWLEKHIGWGWADVVRQAVHAEVKRRRGEEVPEPAKPTTLGELYDE